MSSLRTYRVFISHAWDYSDDYLRIVKMLNDAPLFHWANHSVPRHDPLLVTSDAALERKLRDQMRLAQIVVILSGMYVNHRKWIQKEIDMATTMGKPIVAVVPWGAERTPLVLQYVARDMVRWNTGSIVTAIRRHALKW